MLQIGQLRTVAVYRHVAIARRLIGQRPRGKSARLLKCGARATAARPIRAVYGRRRRVS